MNSKTKKTIGLYVPSEFPYKGKFVKEELDRFFQWLWDYHPDVIDSYSHAEIIKKITGGWE